MSSLNPLNEALKIKNQIVAWRRDFHMHPELGHEEVRTSQIVEELLREWGYRVRRVGTGVIADIGEVGRTVALRADMDALPIQEETDVPYKSRIPGKMHACGHDAHTAMLLGAAKIIAEHKEELPNRARLIFQPAEEVGTGALKMIEAGALDEVHAIFGLHVTPELPTGVVGLREGPLMAGAGRLEIKIRGKGGHGGKPHTTIDPIPVAAQVILAFQTIISRNLDPVEAGVLSVCSLKAGEAFNVIPDDVYMKGTYRFYTNETAKLIEKRVDEILKGVTLAHNVSYELKMARFSPPVVNNPEMVSLVKKVAEKLNLKVAQAPLIMGAEDFAFFLERVPGVMIRLGIRNEEKGIVHPHHSSKFDVDEDVLPIGTALEVGIVFEKF